MILIANEDQYNTAQRTQFIFRHLTVCNIRLAMQLGIISVDEAIDAFAAVQQAKEDIEAAPGDSHAKS